MITRYGQTDKTGKRVHSVKISVLTGKAKLPKKTALVMSDDSNTLVLTYKYLNPRACEKFAIKQRFRHTCKTSFYEDCGKGLAVSSVELKLPV